jgi:hypothetical protein
MKKRMRLSPQNKVKLSVRIKLITLATAFVVVAIVGAMYFIFGNRKKSIAAEEQQYIERFGFYRTLNTESNLSTESTLTLAPFSIIIEHSDFKSKNYGGRLFDASARDLVFVRKGTQNPLKSQIESYDATRGLIHATVWLDSLLKEEKPEFEVYYSGAGSYFPPYISAANSLLISMNDGISGNYGAERIAAQAAGTFKANGLFGNGRGFSNERGDFLQYKLQQKAIFQNGFTLSTWIFPELKNQNQVFGGFRDLIGNEIYWGIDTQNRLYLKAVNKNEESIQKISNSKLGINEWSHVVLRCDAQNKLLQVLLNGNEILSEEINTGVFAPATLFFGRSNPQTADGFTGILDQIELIPALQNAAWCKFVYTNSVNPVSQWRYGVANSPIKNGKRSTQTRNEIKSQQQKANESNNIRFQTQPKHERIQGAPLTVSSSAVILQTKMQQMQARRSKSEQMQSE